MNKLMELLKKVGVTDDNIPETIAIITYPDEHTPLFESRLDLLEIGARVQKGILQEEKLDLLKQWLDGHGFIPVNFCGDPWALDNAEKQLNELLQKDCAGELEKFKYNHQNKVKEKRKKLEKFANVEISVLS